MTISLLKKSVSHTVGLEFPRLAAAVPRLVDGLDNEDVLGAALEAVHGVVVLLNVGHNHPAVGGVAQTCREKKQKESESKLFAVRELHSAFLIKSRR